MATTTQRDITAWAGKSGQFQRQASQFRDQVEAGGRFPPASGRYYLYVSYACPWAHRTLIVRQLKGLAPHIPVSIVHPFMGQEGWTWVVPEQYNHKIQGIIPDPLYGFRKLRELYFKAKPDYSDRFTVPVLWDSKEMTIVNNESSEIIRMFNHAFDDLIDDDTKKGLDFYPESLRPEIDELNGWVYDTVNNGVYKSGFATSQEVYEANVKQLFESLDRLESVVEGGKDWLIGNTMTEADIRLFTTLIRFDPVYVGHFKCNLGTIRANYPNLHAWMRKLYWKNSAFKDTTNFEHIKAHYYMSHSQINPTRIVPVGPLPSILPLGDE